ncbi:MAG: heavy metal-associated domain-containing protein [Neisseria sp.]|nr:heavy metal-associated domain-containing protein [Neisseria sp.]
MNTVTLNISGMTCGGCANSVKRVLSEIPGVQNVEVEWQAGRARVEADDTVAAAVLVDAVEDAGFDAEAV